MWGNDMPAYESENLIDEKTKRSIASKTVPYRGAAGHDVV